MKGRNKLIGVDVLELNFHKVISDANSTFAAKLLKEILGKIMSGQ